MKNLFIGNSLAWLRLGGAIVVLAIASQFAHPVTASKNGQINLASLPKPGSMREW